MAITLNRQVQGTGAPPIAEASGWLTEGLAPAGLDVLDLAQAVPSYAPAEALLDHLADKAGHPETAFYTPILGLQALRYAYGKSLARDSGVAVAADQVAITTGCNHAFCLAVLAVAEPGSEILRTAPNYFNYDMWLDMQGVVARDLPCRRQDEGMVPDPEEARRLVTPRTRAIVLISPNNPTGTIYSAARLAAFFDLARDQGLALILDETYRDFRPDPAPAHDLLRHPDWPEVLIQLYSFSKAYSLTGYRVGALVAGPQVIAQIEKIADTLSICPPHIGQLAALYGLEHLAAWRETKRQESLARVAALDSAFEASPSAFELVSRGAFFAYLRHPFVDLTAVEAARRLLADQALFTLPGSYFGPGQERYLRLAFANLAPERMAEVAARLRAVENLG